MEKRLIILHLSLIENIGPVTISTILQNLKLHNFELEDLYDLSLDQINRQILPSYNLSQVLFNGLKNIKLLKIELELIEKNKICWTTIIDDEYPYLLKNISYPPAVFYWKGKSLDDKENRMAVIGSRKATYYAQKVIDNLIPALVEKEWIIVSGGAIGADTFAHKASLKAGGRTVAILGSGLLKPYPYSNRKFFDEIVDTGGTLVSPFCLNMDALPGNFPARNRIISGISNGCLIVQAAIKSGTRTTALHALEQGREVFAVPGPFDDELSAGCHQLIQQGAKLVFTVNDIFQEFGQEAEPIDKLDKLYSEVSLQKPIFAKSKFKSNEPEDEIVRLCGSGISMDELIEKTNMGLQDLQMRIFELQIEGKIQQNFAGLWEKV